MQNCYISRLTVRGVGLRDSRSYTLMVENKHGRDTVPVFLNIKGEGGEGHDGSRGDKSYFQESRLRVGKRGVKDGDPLIPAWLCPSPCFVYIIVTHSK